MIDGINARPIGRRHVVAELAALPNVRLMTRTTITSVLR